MIYIFELARSLIWLYLPSYINSRIATSVLVSVSSSLWLVNKLSRSHLSFENHTEKETTHKSVIPNKLMPKLRPFPQTYGEYWQTALHLTVYYNIWPEIPRKRRRKKNVEQKSMTCGLNLAAYILHFVRNYHTKPNANKIVRNSFVWSIPTTTVRFLFRNLMEYWNE